MKYIDDNYENIIKEFPTDEQCMDYFRKKYKFNIFEWDIFLGKKVGNISVANLLSSKNVIFYAFNDVKRTLECSFEMAINSLKNNLYENVDRSKFALYEFGHELSLEYIARKIKDENNGKLIYDWKYSEKVEIRTNRCREPCLYIVS